jgi:nucleoside-diphosphate-sugar epimerase
MLAKGMEFYIGSGKQLLSFIYVKDLAMAVFKILSLPATDASYIVSDGRTYGKDEMGSIIKKIINKRTLKINLRRTPILSTEFCIEKIYALFGSMHFLHTEKIKEITASNWSCDSARL